MRHITVYLVPVLLIGSALISADYARFYQRDQHYQAVMAGGDISPFYLSALLPESPAEVTHRMSRSYNRMHQALAQIKQRKKSAPEKLTYANTIEVIDGVVAQYETDRRILEASLVLQGTGRTHDAAVHAIDTGVTNLSRVCGDSELLEIIQKKLSDDHCEYSKRLIKRFENGGAHLRGEKKERFQALTREIAQLKAAYHEKGNASGPEYSGSRDDLDGLPDHFFENSTVISDGNSCRFPVSRWTYDMVSWYCTNAETRRQVFDLYEQRAYPDNIDRLEKIRTKTAEWADLIGCPSCAHYEASIKSMEDNPNRTKTLLTDIIRRAQKKWKHEYAALIAGKPDDVILENGRVHKADLRRLFAEHYKRTANAQKDGESDELKYYQLGSVLSHVLNWYEQFFSITFTDVTDQAGRLWDPSVSLYSVSDAKTGRVLGHIFIDMVKRQEKHVPNGVSYPLVSCLLGNKRGGVSACCASIGRSGMRFWQIKTVVHELAHGLHQLFLNSPYALENHLLDGKSDCKEAIAIFCQEYIYTPRFLRECSAHKESGEPIPENLLNMAYRADRFSGFSTSELYAGYLTLLCLFGNEHDRLATQIMQEYEQRALPEIIFPDNYYAQQTSNYIKYYGSCKYVYMYAKLYAEQLTSWARKQKMPDNQLGKLIRDKLMKPGLQSDFKQIYKEVWGGSSLSPEPFYKAKEFC